MRNFIVNVQNRAWIFAALALSTLIIGKVCKGSCVFIHGDILGLDLEVFGLIFYSLLIMAVIFYEKYYPKDWMIKLITAIVSIGVGAELVLVKFQIQNRTYCPKCLISGFFFLAMFFVLARHMKIWIVTLLILIGAIFTSFTFNGAVIPSYAEEIRCPVFGNNRAQTEIIFYSDYFCPGCRQADSQINGKLMKLKNKARICFIDVPLHRGSLGYAKLFIYAWLKCGNNLEKAIKVREILFDASKTNADPEEVMKILKSKGIQFKKDEDTAKEIFHEVYNPLMKMDKVSGTPTVVIAKGNSRKNYVGGPDILKALDSISSR